jgi:opacity protein-like surface antigen
VFSLLLASIPAIAQYVATPPPGDSPPIRDLRVEAKNGQSEEQQSRDRYECHRWAKTQSGFDPTQQTAGAQSGENASGADGYRRAFAACLEGRGYAVKYGEASKAAPPPASPLRVKAYSEGSEFKYRPLAAQIHAGYSVTTGETDRYLDDGGNIGFGFTWFPTSVLPIGLRVDGSYSRFAVRNALLDLYGGDFASGHDNIYGGDADLQLDLAHQSSRAKMYLFGGVGWYREQTYLRQVSLYQGTLCDPYFCVPGYVPVVTGVQRTTSPWHSSWNAGLGLEIATGDGASFFVEARYQRIAAYNSKLQFVPVRLGLRF